MNLGAIDSILGSSRKYHCVERRDEAIPKGWVRNGIAMALNLTMAQR
jgi:hypothetical protein